MRPLQILAGVLVVFASTLFSATATPKVITWEELVPVGKDALKIDFGKFTKPKGMPDISEFDGSKQEMDEYLESMELMRQTQPEEGAALALGLNGKEIKIAGYVTPISFEGEKVVEFLFVPYLGACAHVPPPPANQIVYVENAKGLDAANLYDPVWLVGKLNATPVSTLVANVGYTIDGARVEPYKE